MYGYIVGAVCSGGAAWYIKKNSKNRKWYEACLILTAGFFLAAVFWQMDKSTGNQQKIARNLPGQGMEEREYLVDVEGVLEEYPLHVQAEEKKLTRKEKQEYLERAKQELDQVISGENPSVDHVSKSLYLPKTLQDGAVEAEYTFSDYEVFDPEGNLTGEVDAPVLAELTVELACQGEKCLYQFSVQAEPPEQSVEERFVKYLKEALSAENQKTDAEYLELPQKLEGKKIIWKEQTENRSTGGLILGAAGAVGVILAEKEKQKRQSLARHQQMLQDYPEIVSKLSLLSGAGMSMLSAWERIALSYQAGREKKGGKRREAYEEMLTVLHEIQAGTGELQAFENFGERCGPDVYRKLSSLIVQNIRKGAKGMQRLLEEEEREAYEQRKARARKAGEEAGTRLLLPMGIMLILVLVLLVVPAGLTLQI